MDLASESVQSVVVPVESVETVEVVAGEESIMDAAGAGLMEQHMMVTHPSPQELIVPTTEVRRCSGQSYRLW